VSAPFNCISDNLLPLQTSNCFAQVVSPLERVIRPMLAWIKAAFLWMQSAFLSFSAKIFPKQVPSIEKEVDNSQIEEIQDADLSPYRFALKKWQESWSPRLEDAEVLLLPKVPFLLKDSQYACLCPEDFHLLLKTGSKFLEGFFECSIEEHSTIFLVDFDKNALAHALSILRTRTISLHNYSKQGVALLEFLHISQENPLEICPIFFADAQERRLTLNLPVSVNLYGIEMNAKNSLLHFSHFLFKGKGHCSFPKAKKMTVKMIAESKNKQILPLLPPHLGLQELQIEDLAIYDYLPFTQLPALQSLHFSKCHLPRNSLYLTDIKQLKTLKFFDVSLPSSLFSILPTLPCLQRLECHPKSSTLKIRYTYTEFSKIGECKELRHLEITPPDGKEELYPLAHLKKLTILRIRPWWTENIIDLSPLSALENLEELELNLRGNSEMIDLSPLTKLPNLKKLTLDLSRNQYPKALAPLRHLTSSLEEFRCPSYFNHKDFFPHKFV